MIEERDLRDYANRLAAALYAVLYDAHPTYSSTAKWYGGIGGQMITSHCSITQGHPPGDEWAESGMMSEPMREYLAAYPFDIETLKEEMKHEMSRKMRHG